MSVADIALEQSVLGSVIDRPDLAAEALSIAEPHMFYRAAHQDLASMLAGMIGAGEHIDPTVIMQRATVSGLLAKLGGAEGLFRLIKAAWSPQHAVDYARQVREGYRARLAMECVSRLQQSLESPQDPEELATLLAMHVAEMDDVASLSGVTTVRPAQTVMDLLRGPMEFDWLVEGLLERGDRLLLTGNEGNGKTVLGRQLACCFAAGMHPFQQHAIPPLSVLVVDCENSVRQNRRYYRRIVDVVTHLCASREVSPDWDRLRIEHRPDSMDLTVGSDPVWLDRLMAASKPDVLMIGPMYKLHRQDMNAELPARELTECLDRMRLRYGCAVIVETHPSHATDGKHRMMRPAGSSLFMRWPEFGLGITRSGEDPGVNEHPEIVDVVPWRGSRDEREWPKMLRHGQGRNALPWVPHTSPSGALGVVR